MAKKEETKTEEDLEKLKLPPPPQPENKTAKAEEPEILEEAKEDEKLKQKSQQGSWTPKDFEVLLRLGMELLGTNLADKYLTYKKNEAESRRRYFESVSTHNRRMIYILIAFLIGIVGFMTVLGWFEKVSGDALLFLVGTITGYIIVSVQRLVFPSEEPPPPTEETK